MHRVFKLAELADTPAYIVHLSSRDALNAVREARDRGMPAFAETCPQYLYLSLDDMGRRGSRVRSSCARRRRDLPTTRRSWWKGSRATICRSSRRTTRPSTT